MPVMAKEMPVYITGQALDAGNPLSAHSSYSLSLWDSAGLPQYRSGTVTQPPAAGSDLLLLLKPWHSGPLQPIPDGLTFHLMSVLGSQDTDRHLEEI